MKTTIQGGKVSVADSGIVPGEYQLCQGFGRSLHLYPQAVWEQEVVSALRGDGWTADRPSILNQDLADLAHRYYSTVQPVEVTEELALPEPLLKVLDSSEVTVTLLPIGGGYWRLAGV